MKLVGLRRIQDGLVGALAGILVRIFFREIEVVGESMPPAGPLVLVANHTNSVLDGLLLLGLWRLRPRVLAKSPLFAHPLMGPILALIGALPVYRHRDEGADVAKNALTFARCADTLAEGGSIAIFPEGTSHNEPATLPLKTGAARIALAVASRQGEPRLRIVPVGFDYEAKDRFRSRLRVVVGQPIDPTPEAVCHRSEPRAAVRALTKRIASGLDRVTSNAAPHHEWRETPIEPLTRGRLARNPVFLVGYALNFFPYHLPGWVSARLATTPDEPATYKLLTGLLSFPVCWAVETMIGAWLGGMVWGVAVALIAPASGYAALRIRERRERP